MKRKIGLSLLALIAIGLVVGFYWYKKETPDPATKKPDVVIAAKDLAAAFEQDSAAARSQYIDKVIQVTGTVKTVDTSGAVVLGEEGSASSVVVGLDRRHVQEAKQLQPGATVVLQGICSGYTKSGGSDPTDLLALLGTTVQLNFGSVKSSN